MRLPFSITTLSSAYGWRRHPRSGAKSFHLGADFKVPAGTPIRSIGAGVVKARRTTKLDGNCIEIDHGHRVVSKYKHMRAKATLKVGRKIAELERIGIVGDTGESAHGPHLHLELWVAGQHVDPLAYIAAHPSTVPAETA